MSARSRINRGREKETEGVQVTWNWTIHYLCHWVDNYPGRIWDAVPLVFPGKLKWLATRRSRECRCLAKQSASLHLFYNVRGHIKSTRCKKSYLKNVIKVSTSIFLEKVEVRKMIKIIGLSSILIIFIILVTKLPLYCWLLQTVFKQEGGQCSNPFQFSKQLQKQR